MAYAVGKVGAVRWVAPLGALRRQGLPYLLLLPSLALVTAVTVYAMIYAFEYSLYSASLLRKGEFVGLRNYWELVRDPSVRGNLYSTLLFLGGAIPLTIGFGLVLSLVLNQPLRFRSLIRTIVLLPWITSYLIAALLWKWLLNADYGPLPALLTSLGLPKIDFLGTHLAMASLVLTTVWHSMAFAMVIMLAALQQVPDNLRWAAEIDGASRWMHFRRIVFPLIKPSVLVCMIVMSLHYLNIITLPLILTGGGPNRATELIGLRLFNEAFIFYNTGFASAIAILVLVMNVLLTALYMQVLSRRKRIY